MPSFTYDFEELPLIVLQGVGYGLVNGRAEVNYDASGDWWIGDTFLEGFREPTDAEQAAHRQRHTYDLRQVSVFAKVDLGSQLDATITHRLETDWRDHVQDAVNDKLAEDRESYFGNIADRRHAEREVA